MDLSSDEIEEYLRCIFTRTKFLTIDGILFLFKQPSNYLKTKAKLLYDNTYSKAKEEGILSTKELEKIIDSRNIITESDKLRLSELESKLEGQQLLLSKTVKVEANKKRIQSAIDKLESEIAEIKLKKWSKMVLSAEYKAREEKTNFYCYTCVYDGNTEELYWNDKEAFFEDSRLNLKKLIFNAMTEFISGISTSVIRYIARNNLWRIRYMTSLKASEALFGVPTSEYTDDMLNLAFWSNYYQNIYEMLSEDKPPEEIISDDKALDAYMKAYYDERDKDNKARKHKKKHGKLSAFDKEEVIVTQSSELYEDIEYDKPREAQRIKDRPSIKKRALGSRNK